MKISMKACVIRKQFSALAVHCIVSADFVSSCFLCKHLQIDYWLYNRFSTMFAVVDTLVIFSNLHHRLL